MTCGAVERVPTGGELDGMEFMFAFMQPGDVVSVFDWVAMHLRLAPSPDEDFRMPDAERGSQGAA